VAESSSSTVAAHSRASRTGSFENGFTSRSASRSKDAVARRGCAEKSWPRTLVVANAPYDALMGPTTSWRGIERNSVWQHPVGPSRRPHPRAESRIRGRVGRRPVSDRRSKLWESGALEPHPDFGRRKVIDHPDVGPITVDCDTLIVAADDLRMMIYTAEPDTEDAERPALAVVLGTPSLID